VSIMTVVPPDTRETKNHTATPPAEETVHIAILVDGVVKKLVGNPSELLPCGAKEQCREKVVTEEIEDIRDWNKGEGRCNLQVEPSPVGVKETLTLHSLAKLNEILDNLAGPQTLNELRVLRTLRCVLVDDARVCLCAGETLENVDRVLAVESVEDLGSITIMVDVDDWATRVVLSPLGQVVSPALNSNHAGLILTVDVVHLCIATDVSRAVVMSAIGKRIGHRRRCVCTRSLLLSGHDDAVRLSLLVAAHPGLESRSNAIAANVGKIAYESSSTSKQVKNLALQV